MWWIVIVIVVLVGILFLLEGKSKDTVVNQFEEDLVFFRNEIYPKLPPVSEWPVQGYLHYEFPGWAKLFPDLRERFHHYSLVQEDEDHWATNSGLFLNGKKVW